MILDSIEGRNIGIDALRTKCLLVASERSLVYGLDVFKPALIYVEKAEIINRG